VTRFRAALSISIFVLLGGGLARADLVHLNTGGVVKGEIVSESDTEVKVKTSQGGVTTIFREDIERIERGQSAESVYTEGLKKLAANDADGHYQLGVQCQKLHLEKHARDCFERALKIDPQHLLAKIALGADQARAQDLVAAAEEDRTALGGAARDDGAPASSSSAKVALAKEAQKALDLAKKQTRADDPQARAAGWDAIKALRDAAESPEARTRSSPRRRRSSRRPASSTSGTRGSSRRRSPTTRRTSAGSARRRSRPGNRPARRRSRRSST
jgi:hypothetical protein